MSLAKIDFQTKKKISLITMASLAAVLALCILVVTVGSVVIAISDFVIMTNGLPENKLTTKTVTETDTHKGSLIVVNQLDEGAHAFKFPDEEERIATILSMYDYRYDHGSEGYGLSGSNLKLHTDALPYAHNMLNAICKDNKSVEYVVNHAYRSKQDQIDSGSDIPVSYSEHHTGYVFTLKRLNSSGLSNEDIEWLKNNAQDYGFILRYPENKKHLTGLATDYNNCLRYVGVAHATLMKKQDLCLEEYITYLKNNASDKHIAVECSNDEQYLIYYYDFEGMEMNIKVPENAEKYPYEISGTNYGGIVVTVRVK